jgi:hypothetical protein
MHQRNLSLVTPLERPLAGIKVVDLTRVLAGPLATQMLSDLGGMDKPKYLGAHGQPMS